MAKHVLRSEDVKKKTEKPTTFIERGAEEPVQDIEEDVEQSQPEDISPVDARVDGLETFADEYGKFSIEVSKHINVLTAMLNDLSTQVAQQRALIFQLNAEVSKLTGDLVRISTANEEFHASIAKAIRETLEVLPSTIDARIAEVLEIEPEETEESEGEAE